MGRKQGHLEAPRKAVDAYAWSGVPFGRGAAAEHTQQRTSARHRLAASSTQGEEATPGLCVGQVGPQLDLAVRHVTKPTMAPNTTRQATVSRAAPHTAVVNKSRGGGRASGGMGWVTHCRPIVMVTMSGHPGCSRVHDPSDGDRVMLILEGGV